MEPPGESSSITVQRQGYFGTQKNFKIIAKEEAEMWG
jgi:hypothetical protein